MAFSLVLKSSSGDPTAQRRALRAFQTPSFLGEGACGAPCRRRRRTLRLTAFPAPFSLAEPFPHGDCNKSMSSFTHKRLILGASPPTGQARALPASLRDSSQVKPRAEPGPGDLSFPFTRGHPSYRQVLQRPAPPASLPPPLLRPVVEPERRILTSVLRG